MLDLIANLDRDTYKKIAENPQVKLEEKEATDIVRLVSRNAKMNIDDSIFENKKAVRGLFREKIVPQAIHGYIGDYLTKGLVDLDDWDMKSCLNLAYQTNNHEAIQLLHTVIPTKDLLLIPKEKGGLKNAAEMADNLIQNGCQNGVMKHIETTSRLPSSSVTATNYSRQQNTLSENSK